MAGFVENVARILEGIAIDDHLTLVDPKSGQERVVAGVAKGVRDADPIEKAANERDGLVRLHRGEFTVQGSPNSA